MTAQMDAPVVGADAPISPAGARRRSSIDSRTIWLPVVSVAATLVILEVISRAGLVSRTVLPPVSEIIGEMVRLIATSTFWEELGQTLQWWLVGLGLGTIVGALLGAALGLVGWLGDLLAGVLELVRPIPSVALIPLAVIMFGVGAQTKTSLVFLGSVWPVLIHTMLGVRTVDTVAYDTCVTYGVPARGRLTRLIIPNALPQFFTGLRVSSAIALIVAITVELIVGAPGLGRQVNIAQQAGATERMYAYIAVIGLIGWAVNSIFQWVERRALRWHVSTRQVTM